MGSTARCADQELQHRQSARGRLAGSGLSDSEQIAAG